MNLQVQTWNLTRGCSLCSARHWPSTSRNLAHLGEVSPRRLPFFLPKKKVGKKKQCVFYRPRFKANVSDTLHASLHVHLWEPDSIDFSEILVGGGRSLREMPTQNGNLSQPQRFSRNSNEAAVANTRKWRLWKGPKTLFGAAMCRLNVT